MSLPLETISDVKVLHVLASDTTGGAETTVALQSERMRSRRVDVEVACLDAPGPIAKRLSSHGIGTYSLGPGLMRASLRLLVLLRNGHYDVVNAYGFKASTIARLAGLSRAPRPAFVHGVVGLHITEVLAVDELKGRFAFAVERRLQWLVDAYEVNSRGAIDLLAQNGVSPERLRYVPMAIDRSVWQEVPASRSQSESLVALCVARFVARKRQADVIRAVHLLKERGVAIEVRFVGQGELRAECEALARRLGVSDRCRFLGAIAHAEIPGLMAKCDAFVIASVWEGMSAAVLEAMASGLPVIGTDVNGLSELFVPGVSGLRVPVRDPAALADALARLAVDADGRLRMGAEAAKCVGELHDIERFVDTKLAIYCQAVVARTARVRKPISSSSSG